MYELWLFVALFSLLRNFPRSFDKEDHSLNPTEDTPHQLGEYWLRMFEQQEKMLRTASLSDRPYRQV